MHYKSAARLAPRASRLRADTVEARLEARYLDYQYRLVEFLAEHLADVSRTFGGDMQMPVILANIGQVSFQATAAARHGGDAFEDLPPERRGMTAFHLADVTSIPRETVRRKLIAMAERGWIEREEGYWVLTMTGDEANVMKDIMPLDRRSLQRASRLYCQLDEIIRTPVTLPPQARGRDVSSQVVDA